MYVSLIIVGVSLLVFFALMQSADFEKLSQNDFDKLSRNKVNATKAPVKDELKCALDSIPGFASCELLRGAGGLRGLAISQQSLMICFLHFDFATKTWVHTTVPFKDIIEVAINKDGISTTKTTRSSSLLRAAAGGLIAGPVGAIIGGLSGKSTTSHQTVVNQIALKLVVNDLNAPVHIIQLPCSMRDGAIEYRISLEVAVLWHGKISVAMHQCEQEDCQPGSFQISGVDKEKQTDVRVVINADSLANAKAKAELQGVYVTAIERLPNPIPPTKPLLEASAAPTGAECTTVSCGPLVKETARHYRMRVNCGCGMLSAFVLGLTFLIGVWVRNKSHTPEAPGPTTTKKVSQQRLVTAPLEDHIVMDSKGNAMRESEIQETLAKIRRQIEVEPDPLKKAYFEGFEKSVLKEWNRLRSK
jgi:hypothetical protein